MGGEGREREGGGGRGEGEQITTTSMQTVSVGRGGGGGSDPWVPFWPSEWRAGVGQKAAWRSDTLRPKGSPASRGSRPSACDL